MRLELSNLDLNNLVIRDSMELLNSSALYLISNMTSGFISQDLVITSETSEVSLQDSEVIRYSPAVLNESLVLNPLLGLETKDIYYLLCDSGKGTLILDSEAPWIGDSDPSANISIYKVYITSNTELVILEAVRELWLRSHDEDFDLLDFDSEDFIL